MEERRTARALPIITFAALAFIIIASSAAATVSVSYLGYHPDSVKTATYYTSAPSGTFDVLRNGAVVQSGLPLVKAKDFAGNPVECQGGQQCLIADFTNVTAAGTYAIRATAGGKTETSPSFPISTGVYKSGAQAFNGFFDAQRSKGSTYHADMNGFADPTFVGMADGSYVLRSWQAGWTLIRLGNAYRRDPQLIDNAGVRTMTEYADYLAQLQDAKIQERSDGVGFRTEDWLSPKDAFVPGPTSLTQLTIYNDAGSPVKTVPVRSLCAANGTTDQACMQFAADYYKCQADEPCVELEYIGKTATRLAGQTDGLGVDGGWYYSWSCYYDVDLANGNYNDKPNPCMVYDATESPYNTAIALLAWTEAIPAINTKDATEAKSLFDRAQLTQGYLKGQSMDADTTAYWGAASFLLYDMTGNIQYLQDAYNARGSVEQRLHHDRMRGSEFYWQEYIRHKAALTANGMSYNSGVNPENIFDGQVIGDYYAGSDPVKISKSGERVYQQQRTYGFSNTRAILSMSVFASKAIDLTGTAPQYSKEVADQQIAWVTGNNNVDFDVSSNSRDMRPTSFIFGIGQNPAQFHSRLLQDSGYAQATAGKLQGMQGTGMKFMDNGKLTYLDGKTTILGDEFGGQGNERGGEAKTPFLDGSKTFKNGKTTIQGWINGPFDVDGDDIYDYDDNRDAYEYTEAENDMAGMAFEAFAYADALHNGIAPLAVPQLQSGGVVIPPGPVGNGTNGTNTTVPPNATNSTGSGASLSIRSTPAGADVSLDGVYKGMTPAIGYMTLNTSAGTHSLALSLQGYAPYTSSITLAAGQNVTVNATLVKSNQTNQTNGTAAPGTPRLVSQHATNITPAGGNSYTMLETGTGVFTVEYNQSARIDWYVDGKLAATQTGTTSSFAWSPTILFSGQKEGIDAVVKASGNGVTNVTFNVHVGEVINPFWDSADTANPTVNVYTQNGVARYGGVSVTLRNGGKVWSETLNPEYSDAGETVWRKRVEDIRSGQTSILSVTVTANGTNTSATYPLTADRSHYRGTAGGGRGGGGGGGGSVGPNTPPEFVYAVFSNDTIPLGQSVTLSADLRDNEEVKTAEAVLTHEDGTDEVVPLALTNGARGYGTWTTVLTGNRPGKYTLTAISMTDNSGLNATAPVGDRAFYVLSDTVLSSEHLLLVYALLNQSTIMPGQRIGIKLDARDYLGVESVEVTLKSKDREIPVVLRRTGGSKNYGTWEGSVALNDSDATYALVTARMGNRNETKETRIYGQKVYVQYVKPAALVAQENAAAPSKTDLRQIVRNPITPLLIGLIGMGVAMLIVSSMTFMKTEK